MNWLNCGVAPYAPRSIVLASSTRALDGRRSQPSPAPTDLARLLRSVGEAAAAIYWLHALKIAIIKQHNRPLRYSFADRELAARSYVYARSTSSSCELDPVDLAPGAADRGILSTALSEFRKTFAAGRRRPRRRADRDRRQAFCRYRGARVLVAALSASRWFTGWGSAASHDALTATWAKTRFRSASAPSRCARRPHRAAKAAPTPSANWRCRPGSRCASASPPLILTFATSIDLSMYQGGNHLATHSSSKRQRFGRTLSADHYREMA